mmetsp:Transcript_22927/g.38534  ORF Transcript_22927/g.38534 Transcript_22927/m.38534 type:complete len:348 (+) Transcript_22927:637-1680(+)
MGRCDGACAGCCCRRGSAGGGHGARRAARTDFGGGAVALDGFVRSPAPGGPQPLFWICSDARADAVVERLRHGQRIRVRHGRFHFTAESQTIRIAGGVIGDQKRVVAQRQFRRRNGGAGGFAEEFEHRRARNMLIKQQNKLPACLEVAHETSRAFAPLRKAGAIERFHRRHVMGVEIGVRHVAIKPADRIAPHRQIGAAGLVIAKVPAGQNDRLPVFGRLFKDCKAGAGIGHVLLPVVELFGRVNLDQAAPGIVEAGAGNALDLGIGQVGHDIANVFFSTLHVSDSGADDMRHDPAHRGHAARVGQQHQSPDQPARQNIDRHMLGLDPEGHVFGRVTHFCPRGGARG